MPLIRQVKTGANIVIQIPLRGVGPAPGFVDGGTAFNAGDPTFTVTYPIAPNVLGQQTDELLQVLLSAVEDAWQKGTVTVS